MASFARVYTAKTAVVLCLLLTGACSKKERQHVTVNLKNGESYSGTLETRDASTVTLITTQGDAKTLLMRQVSSIVEDKPASEVAKNAATAAAPAPAPTQPTQPTQPTPGGPDEPAKAFVPPASGVFTLPAGTPLAMRMREGVDGGSPNSEYGVFLTAVTLDEIKAAGASIPPNTAVNLHAYNRPGSGGKEILFQLSGMVIGGHTYRPVGVSSSGSKDPMLGKLSTPPAETLPTSLRDVPLHVEMFSAVEFRLPAAISFHEVK